MLQNTNGGVGTNKGREIRQEEKANMPFDLDFIAILIMDMILVLSSCSDTGSSRGSRIDDIHCVVV